MSLVHCVPMFSNTFYNNSLLLSELLTSKFLVLTLLAWTCWKVPIPPRLTVRCQTGWIWPIPGTWTCSFVLERDVTGQKCCRIEPSPVSLWDSSSCGMRSVLREEFHPHVTETGTEAQRGLGISPKPYKIPPSELFPLWHHLLKRVLSLFFFFYATKESNTKVWSGDIFWNLKLNQPQFLLSFPKAQTYFPVLISQSLRSLLVKTWNLT